MSERIESPDLTGTKVGTAVVVARIGSAPDGSILYECRCGCGAAIQRRSRQIRANLAGGASLMCDACQNRIFAMQATTTDAAALVFRAGRVVKPVGHLGPRGVWWECECSCGATVYRQARYLTKASADGRAITCKRCMGNDMRDALDAKRSKVPTMER